MDEILKIVLECNRERKLLTIENIKEICNIVIKKNKYDFIENVIVAKNHLDDENCGGIFLHDKIVFFFDGIVNLITKYCDNFTDSYQTDCSSVDVFNFYFLTIIFHELAHARQHYLVLGKHNSVEKNIFSFFNIISKDKEFYHDNYEDILTEVNAINTSYITAQYFYSKLPINYISKTDNNTFQLVTLKTLLYGNYAIDPKQEIVSSPSERIAENFDEELLNKSNMTIEKYANILYKNNLTLYKKLMLGLPISYLEYAYTNLLINTLNVDQDINAIKKLQKRIS